MKSKIVRTIEKFNISCSVIKVIDNCGIIERVYRCQDGELHYIPESLLFSSNAV